MLLNEASVCSIQRGHATLCPPYRSLRTQKRVEEKSNGSCRTPDSLLSDVFKTILAAILPPLGVLFGVGLGAQFWVNVLLTLLGFVLGVIHAVYIISKIQFFDCGDSVCQSAREVMRGHRTALNAQGSTAPGATPTARL